MGRRDGMKERKCGCITFEYGPPIKCATHQAKDRAQEVSEIRKRASKAAFDLGHDLTQFRPYGSCRGKFTAYCHACGAFAIVYDTTPERGDQVCGDALLRQCRGGSSTFKALADTDQGPDANDV